MSFWRGALLWLATAFLFFIANRGAYESYFQDDDLDNIAWTRFTQPEVFPKGLIDPRFSASNFRPVGHFFYRVLSTTAFLDFRPYVAALQFFHLVNVALLWWLLRRLGLPLHGAAACCLLFAFHMAVFDAYWRPMYIFDVLCALFLLLALLLYTSRYWWLALVPFWLAYKSKEIAVGLPLALILYELLLGQRRWKRILPFAAISASFTIQALIAKRDGNDDYTFRFTLSALWTCARYYFDRILHVPWLGFAIAPAAFLLKNPLLRWSCLCVPVWIGPLFFLPGRLFSVYLYVSLIALAILAGGLFSNLKPIWVVLFALVWIPVNYRILRQERKTNLTYARENRAYVEAVGEYGRRYPDIKTLIWDSGPTTFHSWGMTSTLRLQVPVRDLKLIEMPQSRVLGDFPVESVAVLAWDRPAQKLVVTARRPGSLDAAWVEMGLATPIWQFGTGWFPLESNFRWTGPSAFIRLRRLPEARYFVLRVNMGPGQLRKSGGAEVEILLDSRSLGARPFHQENWHSQTWPLPPGLDDDVQVEIRSLRPFQPDNDPRLLGVAVAAVGFTEKAPAE